jgi:hypothetical protein
MGAAAVLIVLGCDIKGNAGESRRQHRWSAEVHLFSERALDMRSRSPQVLLSSTRSRDYTFFPLSHVLQY